MPGQVTLPHKPLDVVLDCVSAYPSCFGHLADCHPPMRPGELENLNRQVRQIAQYNTLVLDFRIKPVLLLLEGS